MASLSVLAAWLRGRLGREELPTLYRPGPDEVGVLGLALSVRDVPPDARPDALFLHRPFDLGGAFAPLGVLTSHEGFDAQLTTADNRVLAARLSWGDVKPFAQRGKVLGLLGTPPQSSWSALLGVLTAEFGGRDEALPPAESRLGARVGRVALMSAMRPELLDAVSDLGALVYVTGQFREGARRRAQELGLGVIALGHRRSELWGLEQLARELPGAFPDLRVEVYAGED